MCVCAYSYASLGQVGNARLAIGCLSECDGARHVGTHGVRHAVCSFWLPVPAFVVVPFSLLELFQRAPATDTDYLAEASGTIPDVV